MKYSLQEALAGFRRAKISSFISIFTVAFLLIIVGIFGIVTLNVDHLIKVLNAKVDIQAFISNTMNDNEIADLGARLLNIEGVENVEFISKEIVMNDFAKEFGRDLFDVLEENPFPSSFSITLKENRRTPDNIKRVAEQIQGTHGIDEVDYNSRFLTVLTRFAKTATIIDFFLLITIALGSLFVVSNTLRLIIIARQPNIETMKLIGATPSFIRRPFIIEGVFQGCTGGVIAFVFTAILVEFFKAQWPGVLFVPTSYLLMLIGLGFFFGLIASYVAIKRFL